MASRTSSLLVRVLRVLLVLLVLVPAILVVGRVTPVSADEGEREALAKVQGIVGTWRATGQPRVAGAGGPWQEVIDWQWKIEDGAYALVFEAPEGRHFRSGRLTYSVEEGTYRLDTVDPEGAEKAYAGKLRGRRLVLEVVVGEGERATQRLTLDVLHENRYIMIFEERGAERGSYRQQVVLGCTKGEFVKVDPDKLCIVTGGAGTISVSHEGVTYYVCCSGCQAAFDADPEKFIAAREAATEGD